MYIDNFCKEVIDDKESRKKKENAEGYQRALYNITIVECQHERCRDEKREN